MQVSEGKAISRKLTQSWKSKLPLLNIKLRPLNAPKDAIIYSWGALIATGKFIIELDNPWAIVGYNLRAIRIYQWIIRIILASERCVEIRCLSRACQNSMRVLFGSQFDTKMKIHYPFITQKVKFLKKNLNKQCRFLFVATQFEIKGGEVLLKAFQQVYQRNKNCRLDMVTYLPDKFLPLVKKCAGIVVHKAGFSRNQIWDFFMQKADILIHPTYMESFGMAVLEALANGLGIIATDVYAIREFVRNGINGDLLTPSISTWDGVIPSTYYYDLENIKKNIRATDMTAFQLTLEQAIERFVVDPDWRLRARQASIELMMERFAC